jgi:hypothetical protein
VHQRAPRARVHREHVRRKSRRLSAWWRSASITGSGTIS